MSLLATLLVGCAAQTPPCHSLDLQGPDNEGAREYCRDQSPLRSLEIAVSDVAYDLLKEAGLTAAATPVVDSALVTQALPVP